MSTSYRPQKRSSSFNTNPINILACFTKQSLQSSRGAPYRLNYSCCKIDKTCSSRSHPKHSTIHKRNGQSWCERQEQSSYLITGIVVHMVLVHNPANLSFLRSRTMILESQNLFGTRKAVSGFDLGTSTSNFPVPCICSSVGTCTLLVFVTRFTEKVTNSILGLSFWCPCVTKVIHGACQLV